jgi:hypothetical protein
MERRVIFCNINGPFEHPDRRTGFRHRDIFAYALAHRGRLLAAGLTILRAFFAAGKPKPTAKLKEWSSYQAWSDVVRHCVVWAGEVSKTMLPDPANLDSALRREAHPEEQLMPCILDGVERFIKDEDKNPTTKELLEWAHYSDGDADDLKGVKEDTLDALQELHSGELNEPWKRRKVVGRLLGRFRGQLFGERKLEASATEHKGAGIRWQVVKDAR